jgi:hypothetical protein
VFTVVETKPETNHVGSYGGHQRYMDATASGCIKLCGEEVGAPNGMFAIDVSIVHPLAKSNSNASTQARGFLSSDAATESMEWDKKLTYDELCEKLGMKFVPIVFTTTGGIGKQFQDLLWEPYWKYVEKQA